MKPLITARLALALLACATSLSSVSADEPSADKPVFAIGQEGKRLKPGTPLVTADSPELRLRPGLQIDCRFRLDALKQGTQTLASKDGEYLLRVEGQGDGGGEYVERRQHDANVDRALPARKPDGFAFPVIGRSKITVQRHGRAEENRETAW